MKRYYLSDIVGTGSEFNPYRSAVEDHPGVNAVAVIPTDPETGVPTMTTCLVVAAAIDHTGILADPKVDAMPDVALDTKLGSVAPLSLTALSSALTDRGLGATYLTDPEASFRDQVRAVGLHLDGNFDENKFDVSE